MCLLSGNINLLQYYHGDVRKCILWLQFVLCALEQSVPLSARNCRLVTTCASCFCREVLDTRVVTQCLFEDLCLDVTHLCLSDALPLTTAPVPTPLEVCSEVPEDPGEAHCALDFSWLSDGACEPKSACESSRDNCVTEVHPQGPLLNSTCVSWLTCLKLSVMLTA